ncbi:MAG: class I adenylate-forming enzyme family protein [Blastocatellia bacterium]
MKIHEVIAHPAERDPHKVAIKQGTRAITYGELHWITERLAEDLRALAGPGTHIGIWMENSIAYIIAYFAIAKAGSIIVPLSISLPIEGVRQECKSCDLDYLITTPARAAKASPLAPDGGRLKRVLGLYISDDWRHCELLSAVEEGSKAAAKDRLAVAGEVAVMLSTSGSNGHPARVMLSHYNLIANMQSFLGMAGLEPTDRALIILPMTASGTNTTELLAYLARGLTITVYPHQVFLLSECCKLLHDARITVINLTPLVLSLMLRHSSKVARRIPALKKVFFASSPVAIKQLQQLVTHFPQVQFYYGYGLTEASPRCTTLLPECLLTKLGSVGKPLNNIDLRIVDTAHQSVPRGQIGEIAVKGPNVMLGYYRRPEDTRAAVTDGWLYTGDLGLLDEDGFLFVKGRKKNVIVSRGISICPEEIEQALLEHEAVTDAFVAGTSDDLLSERVVAYVVLREGGYATERQLQQFLGKRLERPKLPSQIFFVPELERNFNHKLIRNQLAAC